MCIMCHAYGTLGAGRGMGSESPIYYPHVRALAVMYNVCMVPPHLLREGPSTEYIDLVDRTSERLGI